MWISEGERLGGGARDLRVAAHAEQDGREGAGEGGHQELAAPPQAGVLAGRQPQQRHGHAQQPQPLPHLQVFIGSSSYL